MPNYAPADFIPDKALGSKVWDKNNKEYIDLGGGMGIDYEYSNSKLDLKKYSQNIIRFLTLIDLCKEIKESVA